MSSPRTANPQIIVLDTGGQYCHLITRKIRELGVYCEIRPSEIDPARLEGVRGIVISGGPASVYEDGSPQVDPAIFKLGAAILGICYGQQLMAWHMGGEVRKGQRGEYGLAWLELTGAAPIFEGISGRFSIWMSHRDTVTAVPPGFSVLGQTETCAIATMADPARRLYGVQFHPEVVHTEHGKEILSNFLFGVAECERDWNPRAQAARIEEEIRTLAAGRNVFFFVSGGVDSTVAFTLCLKALGPERVRALYVDTGLMREGETEYVQAVFDSLGRGVFSVEHAEARFLGALEGVTDPEKKRNIIGEAFVSVQEEILESGHFLEQNWILGQGTIYPDTIESGGKKGKAALIKTHHNRCEEIRVLMEKGRVVEPLVELYKDEVRQVGRDLGLRADLLGRWPFPGPGLAIRVLCSATRADRIATVIDDPALAPHDGFDFPIKSVGVQGDARTYRRMVALTGPLDYDVLHRTSTRLCNANTDFNRITYVVGTTGGTSIGDASLVARGLVRSRVRVLQEADAIVRRVAAARDLLSTVWQFPVILLPVTLAGLEVVVLRPVDSENGMTANFSRLSPAILHEIADTILTQCAVGAVLLDVTDKPPATIEWE